MPHPWPFNEPENVAVFTVRQVLRENAPILLVCHDRNDGGWQFLTGEPLDLNDAMLVALREVVRHDPTLMDLADLPEGWHAWRETALHPWLREPAAHPDPGTNS